LIFQNNILIIIIANFIFSSNLAYELNYVDSLYKIGDYNNSAKIIKNLYNQDNDNVEIIFRLARSIFLIAEEEKNQKKQAKIYYKGFEYAKKALRLAPNNGYANFWYAAYIGKIGLLEGTKQKILNSYKVQEYGMKAIELIPEYEHCHHLMGRWHYELAELTWFERNVASLVYATVPKGSYKKAIKLFKKAIEINSVEIRHHYWLAHTYKALGKKELAKKEFQIVLSLTPKDKKDKFMQFESRKNL
tara:strand:- start:112 stop:849 length:738 start_codon:yes stop_codon:yes gene_type:complete